MVADHSTANDRVRLHITPFNRDLLHKLLPVSLQSQASNISFHNIQTFPERGFGYVELPAMEAQKLKNKFNGTTLKGSKVRVEEAKPVRKRQSDQAEVAEDEATVKRRKKEKAKPEKGVLHGHQLEEGRIVKRGWTEDANMKRLNKAKKSEKPASLKDRKLRFKTSVPPNAVALEKKSKKESKTADGRAAERPRASVVVNEFSKTSRLIASKPVTTLKPHSLVYEEGKGWLDEDGTLVEAEPPSRKRRRLIESTGPTSGDHSEPETDVVLGADLDEEPDEEAISHDMQQVSSLPESETERSSTDSDSEDDSTSSSSEDEVSSNVSTNLSDAPTPPTTNGESSSTAKEIHPLEALYKRFETAPDEASPNKKPAPIDTSFTFFGTAEADQLEPDGLERQIPQTPHTKKDFEWRSIRSAAPTPDTALPGKRFSFALADEDGEDKDDSETDTDKDGIRGRQPHTDPERNDFESEVVAGQLNGEEEEESEFRKWFYDNRGDLNRGWKKRRREEKKLQRQRDNRRLSRRVA